MIEIMKKMIENGWISDLEKLDLRKNYGTFVKIGIVSETKGFFICRNNEATEITSEQFEGEERVLVPAQKWRGAERSYLLAELRKAGSIPDGYHRNMVKEKRFLKNPSSLIFGDSSTGGGSEAIGIASRSFYDWAYSFEPLGAISVRLTHNSLSDSGSILQDEKGKPLSQAIYNIPYIKPGVKFIRFVTMENISPEMLLLQLIAIIGTTRYGGRTAILGDNIRNEVVAIGFSKGEKPISSYTLMKKVWNTDTFDPLNLILDSMKGAYGNRILIQSDLEALIKESTEITKNPEKLRSICDSLTVKMENQWSDYWKEETKSKGKKGRGEEETTEQT